MITSRGEIEKGVGYIDTLSEEGTRKYEIVNETRGFLIMVMMLILGDTITVKGKEMCS